MQLTAPLLHFCLVSGDNVLWLYLLNAFKSQRKYNSNNKTEDIPIMSFLFDRFLKMAFASAGF